MGENRIKLVAADMDGTLLNRERKITKYTQNVIKKAMAQGVYFVPATGRAVNALPPELKEMEGIRYGIFSNGATIYDLKEEKVIYKNHFEMDRVLELMDFLKQFDLMESISLNGQSYANKKEMQNIDYYELDSNTKAIVQGSRVLVDDLEMFVKEQSTTVEKTTLLFKTMEERRRAADALSKIEDIQFSSSLPKNLEISKKGCNKGDGLFHLAKILNIQKEEIMSCGDADNDRELLESAGLAVVMPAVFTYTLEHNVMRFAQAAVRVWGCQMDFADPKRTALEGIEALRNFLISIGMPKNFAELGAKEEDIEKLAHTCCYGDVNTGTVEGFATLDQKDVENIYKLMVF